MALRVRHFGRAVGRVDEPPGPGQAWPPGPPPNAPGSESSCGLFPYFVSDIVKGSTKVWLAESPQIADIKKLPSSSTVSEISNFGVYTVHVSWYAGCVVTTGFTATSHTLQLTRSTCVKRSSFKPLST